MRLPKGLREGIGRSIGVAAEALGKHLEQVLAKRSAGGVKYALALVELDHWAHWIDSSHQGNLLDSIVAHWATATATSEALEAATAWINGDRDTIAFTIDTLERDGGMALVYTHLDDGWLDASTRRMRADIEARLRYLAARSGWFAPAGEILEQWKRSQPADPGFPST